MVEKKYASDDLNRDIILDFAPHLLIFRHEKVFKFAKHRQGKAAAEWTNQAYCYQCFHFTYQHPSRALGNMRGDQSAQFDTD